MKERPILFSGPMVRALLAGRKTQTRRVVKGEALRWLDEAGFDPTFVADPANLLCPYGVPGDRLWVKETWALHERFTDVARVVYAASQGQSWSEMHRDVPVETAVTRYAPKPFQEGLRPSIHMPRWASRLTLEITDVRVERLQDISEADAEAEGIREPSLPPIHMVSADACGQIDRAKADARFLWQFLWSGINGRDSWDANPWVWAVSFRVLERSA